MTSRSPPIQPSKTPIHDFMMGIPPPAPTTSTAPQIAEGGLTIPHPPSSASNRGFFQDIIAIKQKQAIQQGQKEVLQKSESEKSLPIQHPEKVMREKRVKWASQTIDSDAKTGRVKSAKMRRRGTIFPGKGRSGNGASEGSGEEAGGYDGDDEVERGFWARRRELGEVGKEGKGEGKGKKAKKGKSMFKWGGEAEKGKGKREKEKGKEKSRTSKFQELFD